MGSEPEVTPIDLDLSGRGFERNRDCMTRFVGPPGCWRHQTPRRNFGEIQVASNGWTIWFRSNLTPWVWNANARRACY